jgi:hypothetical protein
MTYNTETITATSGIINDEISLSIWIPLRDQTDLSAVTLVSNEIGRIPMLHLADATFPDHAR